MNEQENSSSSWLLRAHYSRANCHRLATFNPSSSWVALPPKRPDLCAEKAQPKNFQTQSPSLKRPEGADTMVLRLPDVDACGGQKFSFPSFSSSAVTRMNDSLLQSKNTIDCASPPRDEESCVDSLQQAEPSGSSSQGRFLQSLSDTFSTVSNSWLASSETLEGAEQRQSPKNFSKGSWMSWRFPVISPKSSSKVSPAASQKVSIESSPTSSLGSTLRREKPFKKDNSVLSQCRFDILRMPSWSQHLLSDGNERAVPTAENWMVNLSQLLLGERFATGNHSRIYHGIYQDMDVAVKVIRQPAEDRLLADRLHQIFTNEVTTLSSLNHRNIVKFIAACKKPPVLCVITEYIPGGSLRAYLHKREGQLLPIGEVIRMALNIAAGMEYVHTKGVIHRDLKSENLVLGEDGCVKIIDFGVSCFDSICDYKTDDPGTYRWMAPEMLCHKPYTKMVDVYSFGIVVWELLTACVPYKEMSAVQAAFCVVHKNLRPSIPSNCPPALENLMCRCWSADPDTRPEFWEIMSELVSIEHSLTTSVFLPLCPREHYISMSTWFQNC